MTQSKTTDEHRQAVIAFVKERHANTVLGALQIEFTSFDPDAVSARADVGPHLMQHAGIVHGGVFVLLAESVASVAAALSVDTTRYDVMGLEINANHLRPVLKGDIEAIATPVHRGRSTHVYAIDVIDDQGRRVCTSRCTLAIKEKEPSLQRSITPVFVRTR